MEKVSDVLKEFSTQGWPADWETIEGMTKWMESRYGLPSIGCERYPDWGPSMLVDGKVTYLSPITKKYETSPELFPLIGMRWRLEFPNGQIMSVVITFDKQVIERTYTDRGDIPISEVYQFLKSWQSSFKQAQKGRRPHGISPRTREKYEKMANDFWKGEYVSELDYCLDHNIALSTLQRAIQYVSNNRL